MEWILLFARKCFWGCLDVDTMWILLFARMFFGGVWMSGCGYSYLLQCFTGVSGCLDMDIMWILLFARMFFGESGCLDVDKPK